MYRIMIVDDEDYVRDLLVKNIRNSSLAVEVVAVAGDGKEALKSALLLKPDILITDISMPFMNGLELIKEMQKASLISKYVVISGYDEFDYARQAISLGVKDYLLKPFLPQELEEVLEKMINELDSQKTLQQNMSLLREQAIIREGLYREKVCKDLLEGRECRETDYEQLGMNLTGDYYLAGILRLAGGTWDFKSQESVEEFLMLIREGYFTPDIHIYAVSFDGAHLVVIWCGTGDGESVFTGKIKAGMEKIQSSLRKYYQIQLTSAIGSPYKSRERLCASYQEAMAVWRGMINTEHPILFYGEEHEKQEEGSSSSIRDWKNQIRLSVRLGQKDEALLQLKGLIKSYASLSNKKNDYISVSVKELIYAIQNDMEHDGFDREILEPAAWMQDRIHYGSLMDMKEMLESYIETCCLVISDYSEETKASAVVKQMKLLLENNIKDSTVDLEWVADKVHFSSSYVRQIFKQHTGEGVGEYLIRKRMEHAGMLLQKTSLKIQEVSEECGYENQRYFASSFKKFYGCTPTEFKKAVEEERLY